MLAAAYIAPDQTGRLQNPDMARDTGEGHWQRSGEVGDPRIALTQRLQQPPSSRIGERAVRAVQDLIFNHIVDYNGRP